MINGYIVLTKGEPNLYKHAVDAITLGKPIYYADGNKVAFVNSIELVSTDVVIKTSDKQITVASNGTVTEEDTGLRVLEIDASDLTITGATATDDSYISLMTSLNVEKLSDLPVGSYPVIQGKLVVGGDTENIIYIEKTANDYKFVSASDDDYIFTFSDDLSVRVIKL